MKRNKILIIDNSIAVTGALKAIVTSSSLLEEEFEFVFIIPKSSKSYEYLESRGFEALQIDFKEISRKPLSWLLYIPYLLINSIKINQFIKKQGIQIIHMNDFYNQVGLLLRLWRKERRLVTHVRRIPSSLPKILSGLWIKMAMMVSDKIIAVSDSVSSELPEHSKVIRIYDTLELKEKYPNKRFVDGSTCKILYLANFIPGKGHDLALNAFISAYNKNNNLRLKFVGGDMGLPKNRAFKVRLQQLAGDLLSKEIVKFEDFAEDIEVEFKSADIFLNLSESESFSFTCLESLFYGTPLIANDSGGPKELFEHNKSGILVSNQRIGNIVNSILELSDNSLLRENLSREGKKFAKKKFSADNTYRSFLNVYRIFEADLNLVT